jgi:AbrB family looped-hinge helix DNA binding protein
MAAQVTEALTGKSLLQKVKSSNLPKRELAKECGYYTVSKDGEVHVNLANFYDAVLAARGIALEPKSEKSERGREATYRVTVHQNGQIVIGSSYTESMGLKPGDEFEIKLGYKHIRLIQLDENQG